MASFLPVSMMAVNVALAVVTACVAVFALGLLFYTVFARPFDPVPVPDESVATDTTVSPSRLTANNQIHQIPNKSAVIDLKGLGLDTNDVVPLPEPRNSREIEAEMHLEMEAALADPSSTPTPEESTGTLSTDAPTPTPERAEATIEPPFEQILAFPECKRTEDGRRFC